MKSFAGKLSLFSTVFSLLLLLFQSACSQSPKNDIGNEINNETPVTSLKDSTTLEDKKTFIKKVFSSLQTHDIKLYISTYPSENLLLERYLLNNKPALGNTIRKKIVPHDKYIENCRLHTEEFENVYTKGKNMNVDWQNSRLDSIQIINYLADTTSSNYNTYLGTIWFSNKDNSNFFKLNFEDFFANGKGIYVGKIFVPNENIGAKNRFLTRNIKDDYIKGCIKLQNEEKAKLNKRIPDKGNEKLKAMLLKGYECIQCNCEETYNQKTEFNDGVERIKKKEYQDMYINGPRIAK